MSTDPIRGVLSAVQALFHNMPLGKPCDVNEVLSLFHLQKQTKLEQRIEETFMLSSTDCWQN